MGPLIRCAARLRDGGSCNRTVVEGSEFGVHHQRLLKEQSPEEFKHGLPRRKQAKATWRPLTELHGRSLALAEQRLRLRQRRLVAHCREKLARLAQWHPGSLLAQR